MLADRNGTQKKLLVNLGIGKADHILDIGCGNGEKTHSISQHAQRVIGIDPDENQIQAAAKNFPGKNLSFQAGHAESLDFASSSFDWVLFNESFHHIPVKKQEKAVKEAWRVLVPAGNLVITEPIYGKGSFEEISKFYNEEQLLRISAINTINSLIGKDFILSSKQKIHIESSCRDFDDLYQHNIKTKPYANWNDAYKPEIMNILEQCDKTQDGDAIIDYFATVWRLSKK